MSRAGAASPWVALIAGVVGGLVGGGVVRLAPGPAPAPAPSAPTAAVEVAPSAPPVEPATSTLEALEAVPLEAAPPAPALEVAPAAQPEPLDPSPSEEAPPFELGFEVPADASDFVRKEVAAARGGAVDSMLRVADWVADGSGLPASTPGANRWYRRARACCSARLQDPVARRVARAHARFLLDAEPAGWANPEAAAALLQRYAEANPRVADLWLDVAELLEGGRGVEADLEQARGIVERVAAQLLDAGQQGFDQGRAFATWSRYLARGVGGPPDLRAAALWARRAVEGQADYLVDAGDLLPALELYRELDEVPGGVTWLTRYAEKHGTVAFFLGRWYEEGAHGLEPDRERAAAFYRRALELEHAHAAAALARVEGVEAGPR